MSLNSVAITGNLTRDVEIRKTQKDKTVCLFSVAVNERRKNPETGETETFPNYIDCVVFSPLADSVAPLLLKGVHVEVKGKLRWSQWERDGEKRSKIDVIVETIDVRPRTDSQNAASDPAA